jgi:hypothetical protein
MQKPSTIQSSPVDGRKTASARLRRLLLKRIWLPRGLYEALPAIYTGCGLTALAAALFLPGRTWIVPWAIVFGFATLHLGLGIAALRHKFRRKIPDPEPE